MPIQEGNIVFVESQIMDDVPEGGGAATGNIIPDGMMNNVFEDISDLDRAYGRFNLRKLFLAVRALNTDLYGGAKTVIAALPTDPALGYTLFTTNSPWDTRATAAARVEAYLYKGPAWHGVLNENHITGMRAISVVQRIGTELPPLGKTLCLVQDEGLAGQKEQYVRVTKVTAVVTTFEDDKGEFQRLIVRLDLSDALRYDLNGHTVNRTDNYNYTGKTRIRNTTVADATKYYGSQYLAAAANIGDLTVKAASIFTKLVPSAQTETPLVNQPLAAEKTPILASRASSLTYTVAGAVIAPNGRFVLDTGALPGSISVTVGAVVITDDSAGNAIRNSVVVGLWDYATGECLFNASAPSASGSATVTYIPAAAVAQQSHTLALPVTAENRRLNWIETLAPIPATSTFDLAYRAQGNWYVLRDNGAGVISGSDATFGAGTLSYVTGVMSVTLGALPDVGSQIMLTWASPVHTTIRAGAADVDLSLTVLASVNEPVKPGTMVITWLVSGVTKTATANAAGTISGDCTGKISHPVGDLRLAFTTPPDAGSRIGLDYERVTQTQITLTGVSAPGGIATVNLGVAIEPGTLEVRWSTQSLIKNDWGRTLTAATWDGIGEVWQWKVIGTEKQTISGGGSSIHRYERRSSDNGAGAIISTEGIVNYATGALTLPLLPEITETNWSGGTWNATSGGSTIHTFTTGVLNISYTPAGVTPVAVSTEIDLPPITVRLLPRLVDEQMVAGGTRFRWNGQTYVERSGLLYRAISPVTGAGTLAGSVDYLSGIVTLTDYVTGSGAITVDALLGRFGDWTATEASFRTTLAPVKSEALSIVAVTSDGDQITGAADPDGVIVGDWMRGTFDYEQGCGRVEFGHLVSAVWTPREVDPATIRYNAVAYSYLPLDANILGIDPVRLPSDGRVPIYRPGDVVMVLHTANAAPATIADGGTLSAGRTRLAWVRVIDSAGATVAGDLYTLDRAAGIVTVPSVAGLAQPLTLRHTVGDLRQITDAQINGQLTLARPLTHAYPADTSLVAACLIHGDRRARVSAVWDQVSWNSTWTDSIQGTAATATLNVIDFPITVTNEGCDTDRWLLRWTSTTAVELISENRGLVWTGSFPAYVSGTPVNIAPINPRTRDGEGLNGVPYLTIDQRSNGGGWSAGNVVRINTVGAIADLYIARSIQQSDEPDGDGADGCEIYALGNIDRP